MIRVLACLALAFLLIGCANSISSIEPKTPIETLIKNQEHYAIVKVDSIPLYEGTGGAKPFNLMEPTGFIIIGEWVQKTFPGDRYYKIKLDSGKEAFIEYEYLETESLKDVLSNQEAQKLNTTALEYAKQKFKEKADKKETVLLQQREEAAREKEQAEAEKAAFLQSLNDKGWDKQAVDLILEKKIGIGMTSEQVIFSWGKPGRVNESVGSYGRHEQWIYGSTYVYFENGVMTSWQRSR